MEVGGLVLAKSLMNHDNDFILLQRPKPNLARTCKLMASFFNNLKLFLFSQIRLICNFLDSCHN